MGLGAAGAAEATCRGFVLSLNAMLRDIETETRELHEEKRHAGARFAQRKARLDERRAVPRWPPCSTPTLLYLQESAG